MKRLSILLYCTILLFSKSLGQDFDYQAKTAKVSQKGFYNILLTPEITTHLKDNFSDVRLYDEKGNEIPYLLRKEEPLVQKELFKEYAIIENAHIKNCCTKLILQNSSKSKINNISLIIKNSDAQKKAKLSGSNDKTDWYIVKDEFPLEAINNNNETFEVKILNFPLSDYEYYRLEIIDSTSGPLNIVSAGFYDTFTEDGKYLSVPASKVSQKDSSDKSSYVHIAFPQVEYIDKLKLTIEGPSLYFRTASICEKSTYKRRTYYTPLVSFELRSNYDNIITLNHLKAKDLYLIIENKDNAPLKITKAEGTQLMHYLTANLDDKNVYHLKFGNIKSDYPQYDLEYFRDSIPANVAIIYPENITHKTEVKELAKSSIFNTTTWIWTAIIGVILLLGFMSRSMIKEMNSKQA